MRIVFLSPTLGDAYGQEQVLEQEVAFLKKAGHRVYLIGDQLVGSLPLCDGVISVKGISSLNSLSPLKHVLGLKIKLLKELEKIQPDIIHFVDQFDSRLMKVIAKRYPTVLTAHTVAPTCPSSQRFFPRQGGVCSKKSGWSCFQQSRETGCLAHFKTPLHRLHALFEYKQKRRALRLFSGIGAISPYLEKTLVKDGFTPSQVFPLYNFIEEPSPQRPFNKLDPPLLLAVARLVPLKGLDSLLNNLHLIPHLSWQCWIFGDGPLRSELEDLARKLHLEDRVFWKGKCPSKEVQEALEKASVFIQPNRGPEGFGMAVAEALSQGVPVLAYDVPALNDLVTSGKNGILVPLQKERGLAPELEKMLEDPDYLKSLSCTNSKMYESYSSHRHFESLLKFYEKAQDYFKEKS